MKINWATVLTKVAQFVVTYGPTLAQAIAQAHAAKQPQAK